MFITNNVDSARFSLANKELEIFVTLGVECDKKLSPNLGKRITLAVFSNLVLSAWDSIPNLARRPLYLCFICAPTFMLL